MPEKKRRKIPKKAVMLKPKVLPAPRKVPKPYVEVASSVKNPRARALIRKVKSRR